jgi:ergothioneine biosynthesis protein EgtB
MSEADTQDRRSRLMTQYGEVRALTEELAAPLSPEDQTIQSMPDVSPTKWHLGHTSWFFETFLLQPELPSYEPCHPAYAYVFNSYYEGVGARHPRSERGLLSRPGAAEVLDYRQHVDGFMDQLLAADLGPETLDLVELGLNHEQQHQELLLMDIKHVLSCNPLRPAYAGLPAPGPVRAPAKAGWIEHQGGAVEIGHLGAGFGFDNEFPRHTCQVPAFAVADRPVTCGEWLAFIDDDGYRRPELWLSDGWAVIGERGWDSPLYWNPSPDDDGAWTVFTLRGERPVDPAEPVCHVSYYEADAFAHWSGARLPTEAEWETVAAGQPTEGNLLDPARLHPSPQDPGAGASLFGDVWEWTASAYSPYPGFRPAAGAVGEYNGKFMVNQYVLRGGSCVTPPGHVRATYRNFFPADARWVFNGVRLARDL